MKKISDMTLSDLRGAFVQFENYIRGELGFDYSIKVSIEMEPERVTIWCAGDDAFQKDVNYGHKVGHLACIVHAKPDDDYEATIREMWDRLQKAMRRDERELRFGLKRMGGILEEGKSFTSHVGKMFAERIKAARDEATNYMIEHHGWAAE